MLRRRTIRRESPPCMCGDLSWLCEPADGILAFAPHGWGSIVPGADMGCRRRFALHGWGLATNSRLPAQAGIKLVKSAFTNNRQLCSPHWRGFIYYPPIPMKLELVRPAQAGIHLFEWC